MPLRGSRGSGGQEDVSAALQQFEEQMKAAEVVSAATRPINLYYGLVQAGLAMTAAHTKGRWTFDKHGLKILDMKCGIPDITVHPEGVGAFQAVSEATGSDHMTDAVSVGALWNSFPELAEVPLDGTTAHPVIDFLAS
ncbi:YaaC family protein [Streptomyces olivochromogenes]|uniref:YaaC family protein n=1 Tax=Streptomyces olivochromogenes TaxID=1963 RepID=UPI003677C291